MIREIEGIETAWACRTTQFGALRLDGQRTKRLDILDDQKSERKLLEHQNTLDNIEQQISIFCHDDDQW